MSKTITVKLDAASINDAIRYLRDYSKTITKKRTDLLKDLTDIGQQIADPIFGSPDGENDPAKVRKSVRGKHAEISVTGEDVTFIEFGAGVGVNEHPMASQFGYYDGSYSDKHGGPYSKYGVWMHNYTIYTMIPAGKGMYYASKAIRKGLPRIAKRIFARTK